MDIGAAGNRPTNRTGPPPVVVGVDGSSCAEFALRYAMTAATHRGTVVHLGQRAAGGASVAEVAPAVADR